MAGGYSLQQMIPGPPPLPLLGWRGQVLRFHRDPLAYLRAMYQAYGSLAALVHGHEHVVSAIGPGYHDKQLASPELFTDLLRITVPITASHQHPYTQPQLSDDDIATYCHLVAERTEEMVSRWGVGGVVDAAYVLPKLTLRIAAQALFGQGDHPELPLFEMYLRRWSAHRFIHVMRELPTPFPVLPSRTGRHYNDHLVAILQTLVHSARDQATQSLATLKALGVPDDGDNSPVVIDHIFSLLVILHELSGAALAWTFFLLSQHVSVLTDLMAELSGVLRGSAPTPAQLQALDRQLPLLSRVIKESLRLLPPRSITLTTTTSACTFGQYHVPADTLIVSSPYLTHRLPELYLTPQQFRPQRWLYVEPDTSAYLPFGGQPHLADVEKLAIMQIACVLAIVLQHYQLALAPGVSINRGVGWTLQPRTGLAMVISPRDRAIPQRLVHGNICEMIDRC